MGPTSGHAEGVEIGDVEPIMGQLPSVICDTGAPVRRPRRGLPGARGVRLPSPTQPPALPALARGQPPMGEQRFIQAQQARSRGTSLEGGRHGSERIFGRARVVVVEERLDLEIQARGRSSKHRRVHPTPARGCAHRKLPCQPLPTTHQTMSLKSRSKAAAGGGRSGQAAHTCRTWPLKPLAGLVL